MTKETKHSAKTNTETTGYALPSAFDLFTPSIAVIRNNLTGFLILMGLPLVIMSLDQSVPWFVGLHRHGHIGHVGIVGLVGMLLAWLTAPGAILLQLAGTRNETLAWRKAFRDGLGFVWRFLGLAILTGLMLTVAFVLLVVPFFILLPRVALAIYYLVDRDLGPVAAIKASMADYKQYKGTWGIIGVSLLLGILNVIPLVGWALSIVIGFFYRPAPAIRYEQIKALHDGKPPRTPIEVATITE